MQQNYPTEWKGGKLAGDIYEKPTCYQVRISPPNQKSINEFYNFNKYSSKENAYLEALKFHKKTSDQLGLTFNQYRYIDKNTIEIKLIGGKIMKTDAKFLDLIEKYNMGVKKKISGNGERYYVTCRTKKEAFPFVNLISTYVQVGYNNGDTLDVRLSNLKEMRVNKLNHNNIIIDEDDNVISENQEQFTEYDKLMEKVYNAENFKIDYKKSHEELLMYKLFQFDKAKKIVIMKKGKMLSNPIEYIDAYSKLKIECPQNHIFYCTLSNLNLNRWCPDCNIHLGELLSKCAIEHLTNTQFKKVRPDWLKIHTGYNLEIDAYNNDLKLGLEYHGVQHYQFVHHFHKSKEDFEKRKEYDQLKEQLCTENGINLIVVPYTIKNEDICKFIHKELINLGYSIPESNISTFNINDIHNVESKTETLKQTLLDKGYEFVEGLYLFSDSIITYKCNKDHNNTTKAKYIMKGSGCDTCAHERSVETKDKISEKLIARFKTQEGKEAKKLSLEKRSETMKQQKEELRSTITHKICPRTTCIHKGVQQEITNFGVKSDTKDGLQSYCKDCYKDIKKERKNKTKTINSNQVSLS
ncbi:hypothetical protein QKU48_gp0880 [Fadolivirus algeromassiliense]|jgi:hypothetical protein|uniref:Uncharacterized protein n=1 Tax=Fadolivirus FV1/VV64 TaxID=3070911 RepID=A0A7D3R297_9VIRU|nr:hypothetical protein QKU48_gp0880 [Fadolivirus algeromassiliense]QKF94338.1 hypothetical protein Fadolivirus_1_880 [Fadolivirus FV1/VV64]